MASSVGIYLEPHTNNIGIGTTSPLAKQHVSGDVLVTHSGTGAALTVNQQGAGKIFEVQDAGTACVTVLDGGNVGIGTTNPLQKLHVVGNTRIQGDAVITGNWSVQGTTTTINTFTSATSNVQINNASGNGPALRVTQSGIGSNYPIADFYDNDVSTTVPALRIADGGNVGIGTTDPLQKLHVQGSVKASAGLELGGIPNQGGSGGFRLLRLTPITGTATQMTFDRSIATGAAQNYIYNDENVMEFLAPKFVMKTGNLEVNASVGIGGNVGIGTTNPQAKLHINGGTLSVTSSSEGHPSLIKLSTTTSTFGGGNDGPRLEFGTLFTGNGATYFQAAIQSVDDVFDNSGYGGLEFLTYDNFVQSIKMKISSNGNVGIGTVSPLTKLHVNGVIRQTNSLVMTDVLNNYTDIARNIYYDGGWRSLSGGPGSLMVLGGGTASDSFISFNTFNNAATTAPGTIMSQIEAMRIDKDGNVGIGRSPLAKFHISSPSSITDFKSTVYNDSSKNFVLRNDNGSVQYNARYSHEFRTHNGTSTLFVENTVPYDTLAMNILQNGNVGIGTIIPVTPLHIRKENGTYRTCTVENTYNAATAGTYYSILYPNASSTSAYHFIGYIAGVGDKVIIYGNGNISNTNNSYSALSDIKLKQDISDAASQWDDIKNLKVRKYRFKQDVVDSTSSPYQIGLVAQEVELISPNLVETNVDRDPESGDNTLETTKSVKYSVLYMKAVKALQEAMVRIEALETQFEQLKAQFEQT